MDTDRNFDDLAPRFARNIYGGLKGALRLAVLRQDFADYFPQALAAADSKPLRIIDAGGGQGQFALQLAALGHSLTLCDISAQMLLLARESAAAAKLEVAFVHGSIAQMSEQVREGERPAFDLVICHSVLEWVANQDALLEDLGALLLPGALLSLSFYNRHGLIMKNLLRGRRPPILDGQFKPSPGSLTPTRPLDPAVLLRQLQASGWEVLCHSGIRVFHDLLLTPEGRAMPEEDLLRLELELSRQEPYRSLGRYQHVLARRLCPAGQTE